MDALSTLIQHAAPKASLFFSGNLCQSSVSEDHYNGGQLHLLRSGQLALHQAGSPTLMIDEPTLIVYPRGQHHRLQPMHFSGCDLVCARLSFRDSPLFRALPDALIIPLAQLEGLAPTIHLLFDEAFSQRYAHSAIVASLLDLLLLLLLRHLVEHHLCPSGLLAAMTDPKLAKAIEAIHANPDTPWTIADLAKLAGMSRSQFAARFHHVIGQPPLSYVTESRLLLAQQLLLAGQPVKLIALEVGYSGGVAFSRAFERQFGCTPTRWLQQQNRNKQE
ncbi:helix-turn-helix transcriptional regulator [Vibrio cholerae]|uniref:AraC family transcriptional regulator n=1 Tax=Vibrio metoecus TaxID=1481663 RepID=A0ABR4RZN1_VIBMT|nr:MULTISPECIES: AraC family transcriptional regulator [Vibrio]KDO14019.1 AraC family transcriptional regulator [Vibrio metoecus]KQA25493.1 AraC family transcriptional regulator [Vibrio metoecus]MDP4493940.1 AraC family transcriptional regulator [Vibrio sp. AH4]PAR95170.1 AraC family transcriptional regulator [Vibrio cholerae]